MDPYGNEPHPSIVLLSVKIFFSRVSIISAAVREEDSTMDNRIAKMRSPAALDPISMSFLKDAQLDKSLQGIEQHILW
ncbi:hypothetical protein [Coriobacterium glomerans]|uniref:hypothetical protein n=1 Tax=Coriobacterium glomerans TaxID=33871 RepID=UPI00155AEF9C|nr:hypothetical protein [Coriobacterium glomerans]